MLNTFLATVFNIFECLSSRAAFQTAVRAKLGQPRGCPLCSLGRVPDVASRFPLRLGQPTPLAESPRLLCLFFSFPHPTATPSLAGPFFYSSLPCRTFFLPIPLRSVTSAGSTRGAPDVYIIVAPPLLPMDASSSAPLLDSFDRLSLGAPLPVRPLPGSRRRRPTAPDTPAPPPPTAALRALHLQEGGGGGGNVGDAPDPLAGSFGCLHLGGGASMPASAEGGVRRLASHPGEKGRSCQSMR